MFNIDPIILTLYLCSWNTDGTADLTSADSTSEWNTLIPQQQCSSEPTVTESQSQRTKETTDHPYESMLYIYYII